MEAVRIDAFEESTLVDVPRPTPGPDEVLIEVSRVQLSVTECWQYQGEDMPGLDAIRERMAEDGRLFGHEFCGQVVEVGSAVEEFAVGDRVSAPGQISCGECGYCRRDFPDLCSDVQGIGHDRPGALAEYVLAPTEPLCGLPDGVSDAAGAALQPLASASMSVISADIQPGDVVGVLGAGVMGNQLGQLALAYGANSVLAVDIDQEKLDLAASFGMTPIDGREVDPATVGAEHTGGIGADIVFESVGGEQTRGTGSEDPLSQSFDMVRHGGKVVQVGLLFGDISLTPLALRSKCVDWIHPLDMKGLTPTGPNGDVAELTLNLLVDDRVSIDEFVTHEVAGLDEFERAVDITVNKDEYDAFGPAQIVV